MFLSLYEAMRCAEPSFHLSMRTAEITSFERTHDLNVLQKFQDVFLVSTSKKNNYPFKQEQKGRYWYEQFKGIERDGKCSASLLSGHH
jgi:hypothetical protein